MTEIAASLVGQGWRGLVLSGAFVGIGLAAAIVKEWAPRAVERHEPKAIHVALVATSWSLLIAYAVLVTGEAFIEAHNFRPRSLVAGAAIALGDVALVVMLRDLQRRGR